MERLYTAFVSSTFRDLQRERAIVATSLLNLQCVPLGMEYFPSTGEDQWRLILDSINAADFCVFLIAGRYGSIVPGLGISWTEREYREALSQGKPMIVLLYRDIGQLCAANVESDSVLRNALLRFRGDIELNAGCRYFLDDAEMMTGLFGSISSLKSADQIQGWVPAGARPVLVQETDFDRTYQLIEIEHRYDVSPISPNALAMTCESRRVIRGNAPQGLQKITQAFSRDSDSLLPFDVTNSPTMEILAAERSDVGRVQMSDRPRKATGAAYARDILLSPPLGMDEILDLTVRAYVPAYKHAYREDLLTDTVDALLGPRLFDFNTRQVSYPTQLLVMRIFLPDHLHAVPAGPKVGGAGSIDETASAQLIAQKSYREWREVADGSAGIFMELRIENPQLNRHYRLTWLLPSRLKS